MQSVSRQYKPSQVVSDNNQRYVFSLMIKSRLAIPTVSVSYPQAIARHNSQQSIQNKKCIMNQIQSCVLQRLQQAHRLLAANAAQGDTQQNLITTINRQSRIEMKEAEKLRIQKQNWFLNILKGTIRTPTLERKKQYLDTIKRIMHKMGHLRLIPELEEVQSSQLQQQFTKIVITLYLSFFDSLAAQYDFKTPVRSVIRPNNNNITFDLTKYLVNFTRDYFKQAFISHSLTSRIKSHCLNGSADPAEADQQLSQKSMKMQQSHNQMPMIATPTVIISSPPQLDNPRPNSKKQAYIKQQNSFPPGLIPEAGKASNNLNVSKNLSLQSRRFDQNKSAGILRTLSTARIRKYPLLSTTTADLLLLDHNSLPPSSAQRFGMQHQQLQNMCNDIFFTLRQSNYNIKQIHSRWRIRCLGDKAPNSQVYSNNVYTLQEVEDLQNNITHFWPIPQSIFVGPEEAGKHLESRLRIFLVNYFDNVLKYQRLLARIPPKTVPSSSTLKYMLLLRNDFLAPLQLKSVNPKSQKETIAKANIKGHSSKPNRSHSLSGKLPHIKPVSGISQPKMPRHAKTLAEEQDNIELSTSPEKSRLLLNISKSNKNESTISLKPSLSLVLKRQKIVSLPTQNQASFANSKRTKILPPNSERLNDGDMIFFERSRILKLKQQHLPSLRRLGQQTEKSTTGRDQVHHNQLSMVQNQTRLMTEQIEAYNYGDNKGERLDPEKETTSFRNVKAFSKSRNLQKIIEKHSIEIVRLIGLPFGSTRKQVYS